MKNNTINIRNAHIHNLKNIDVTIPKEKLTVITGVSGSGKSSLAFDTLYEEGKRRYLMFSDTQFGADSVPSFDTITGLSPTVAVEQRTIRQSNPRSTVGTRTKLSALLAMLFTSYGKRDPKYNDNFPLSMEMFQRNSARGMCARCIGKGYTRIVYEDKIYGDINQTIGELLEGKFTIINSWHTKINDYLKSFKLSLNVKLKDLTEEQFIALKYGSPKTKFKGVNSYAPTEDNTFEKLNNTKKISERQKLFTFSQAYAEESICPKCKGTGLGIQGMYTTINGKNISELENMYINELLEFLENYAENTNNILAKEIYTKLRCMSDVGLYHLALSRPVPTLSGGEIQRLFLASYIIAEMDSIIFVFDEPTIGLHELEKDKLISIINNLVERGNTVIAIEHDANFINNAGYIIDMRPGAGTMGGEKIFEGVYSEFLKCKNSKTSPFIADRSTFNIKPVTRQITDKELIITGADIHNLKNVTVHIPLGVMTGIAGVSGSGKSSLISDTLVPKIKEMLKNKCITEDLYEINCNVELYGTSNIKKCIVIDQKPIGRSVTSCPATYTGIYDRVRELFAATQTAKDYGYSIGMFSVNSEGGCRVCHGQGIIKYHIGMGNYIEINCEACGGTGFLPETMEVELDGKNIKNILDMTIDEAAVFFEGKDKIICNILKTMQRVGMGYITLGQKTPTISGGESQRIKLAKELSKGRNSKDILYILDEPTTGLSFYDSQKLMDLLQELVDTGNSVIITEHDPYVLSNCDYIIELGRGGGSDGGNIIATGTPSELKNNKNSIIGGYLF